MKQKNYKLRSRNILKSLALFCLCFFFAFTAKSQTDCYSAISLSGATPDITANHSGLSSVYVWYTFTPASGQSGVYTASTCGKTTYDTEIIIYEGTSCGDFVERAYSADAGCNDGSHQSKASFFAEEGKTYYFKWWNRSGQYNYEWDLTVTGVSIGGDSCSRALPLAGPSEDLCAYFSGDGQTQQWYSFTPTEKGLYKVSNCGNSISPPFLLTLVISEGTCDSKTIIKEGTTCSNGNTAIFTAEAGTTYLIAWWGYTEFFYWSLSEVNSTGLFCEKAIVITEPSDNIFANCTPSNSEQWYSFTPSESGTYRASNCASSSNSSSYLYINAGTCDAQTQIAEGQRCDYSSDKKTATFAAQAGTTYYILWNSNDPFNWSLSKVDSTGLSCQKSIVITEPSDNITANCTSFGSSQWYSFTPSESGTYRASNCASSSNSSSYLYINAGTCGAQTQIAEGQSCDYSYNTETATFTAQAGTTYYIHWNSYNPFNWSLSKVDPTGLYCETPIEITELSDSIPAPHSTKETNYIWYHYTPTSAGYYTIVNNTDNSSLYFYTGNCDHLSDLGSISYYSSDRKSTFYLAANQSFYVKSENYNYYSRTDSQWEFRRENDPVGLLCEIAIDCGVANNIAANFATKKTQSLWYKFAPTETGVYTLNANRQNYFYVSEGSCTDKRFVTNGDSLVSFTGESGKTYYIEFFQAKPQAQNIQWNLQKETTSQQGWVCENPIVLTNTSEDVLANHAGLKRTAIWYSFTPTATQTGIYKFTTCGKTTESVYFEVYDGNCASKNGIDYFDSYQCSSSSRKFGSFRAEAGKTYYFLAFTYGNMNNYNWSFTQMDTTGRDCAAPIVLTDVQNDIAVPHAEKESANLWYAFTPKSSGYYQASNIGKVSGNYYSARSLNIYAGSCNNRISIGELKQSYSNGQSDFFYAEAGKTYYINWYLDLTYYDYNYTYTWDLKAVNPEGLSCKNPIVLSGVSENILADHSGKNTETLYYSFTPTESGVYTASSCGKTTEDTYLEISKGSCGNDIIGSSDYNCNQQSLYSFYAEAGTTYQLIWANHRNLNSYSWDLSKEANTAGLYCQNAIPLSDTSSNIMVEKSTIRDSYCWYAFTPKKSAYYGTNMPYALIYKNCGDLNPMPSPNAFYGEAGTIYYIRLNASTFYTYTWQLYEASKPSSFIAFRIVDYYGYDYSSFDFDSWDLIHNYSASLYIESTPSGSSYKSLSWESLNPAVATVNNGVVSPVSAGSTYVVATMVTENAVLKDSCLISVSSENLTSLSISNKTLALTEGKTSLLTATILPTNVGDDSKTVTWQSTNNAIATITNGVVVALKEGTAKIMVTANSNKNLKDSCVVTVTKSSVNIPVTGVGVSPKTMSMNVNAEYTITAAVMPFNASNKTVTWASDNQSVATVDAAGKVSAKSKGTARIIATTQEGNFKDTCMLTVGQPATGISLKKATTILIGNQEQLVANLLPTNADNTYVYWYSNNSTVADVNSTGLITATGIGTALIYAEISVNGSWVYDTCKVTVANTAVAVSGVSLNKTNLSLKATQEEQLTASITPETATNQNIRWSSSDTNIVRVRNGHLYAKVKGIVTITVTTEDGNKTASCVVTVIQPVTNVTLSPQTLSLAEGETGSLVANVLPANADNKNISWSSSDTNIAKVNSSGNITAIKEGTATITVTTADGGYTATCVVTVSPTTGIEEAEAEEATFVVYPNPVINGQLTIETGPQTPKGGIKDGIQLFDLVGKLVGSFAITGEKTEINIGHLPSGTYVVKVGTETVKVIKR